MEKKFKEGKELYEKASELYRIERGSIDLAHSNAGLAKIVNVSGGFKKRDEFLEKTKKHARESNSLALQDEINFVIKELKVNNE